MKVTIPGHEDYTVELADKVTISKGDKVLTPCWVGNAHPFYLVDGIRKEAEYWIELTFPGIQPEEYMYVLYSGIENRKGKRTRQMEIAPGIVLYQLWGPHSYMIEGPDYYGKEIRKMYPGPIIEVEEGDDRRKWKETYFTSSEHLRVVALRLGLKLQLNESKL